MTTQAERQRETSKIISKTVDKVAEYSQDRLTLPPWWSDPPIWYKCPFKGEPVTPDAHTHTHTRYTQYCQISVANEYRVKPSVGSLKADPNKKGKAPHAGKDQCGWNEGRFRSKNSNTFMSTMFLKA